MTLWRDVHVAPVVATAATREPITVGLAKDWVRQTGSGEDALIGMLAIAARAKVESDTGLKLQTQTWDLWIDDFPSDDVLLPFGPLQSVSSIKSYDEDGVESTLAATNYQVDIRSLPPRISLSDTGSWPDDLRAAQPAVIRCVLGYAGTAIAVTSMTRSSTTVTVTTTAAHGLSSGNVVVVAGATQAGYNGTWDITVSSATVFTFTVTTTPDTPATGTITATPTGVPAELMLALRLLVGWWYMHRGDTAVDEPPGYAALIAPYRLGLFG